VLASKPKNIFREPKALSRRPEDSQMRIAFVNQPIDTILLPYQSSVGACTYGAACSLSEACEVLVYGTRNRHKEFPDDFRQQNIHFRFFSVSLTDRLAMQVKPGSARCDVEGGSTKFSWDCIAEDLLAEYERLF
jgi:hypothetical protein